VPEGVRSPEVGRASIVSQTVGRIAAMTVEDFLAFTDSRPDDERWELIGGEPVLNASPACLHQYIVRNLLLALARFETENRPAWCVIPGIGVKVSDVALPVPDLLVRPRDDLAGSVCDDAVAAFEVLSPSTADRDLRWKRRAYTGLPTLSHYVVVAQDRVEVVAYDRDRGFGERRLEALDAILPLPALGIALPLADIYENTPLGKSGG
jgi:Uma2 family endonuclease